MKRTIRSGGRKQHFTTAQKKAYWMGVGISNSCHDNCDLLDHPDPKIRASVRAGYEANNHGDKSHLAFLSRTEPRKGMLIKKNRRATTKTSPRTSRKR